MGWFGGFVSKVKSGAKKLKEGAKKAVTAVKTKVTNVWNKYTGKDKFNEADELYKEIIRRYDTKKKKYDTEVASLSNEIDASIHKINTYKKQIKTELFNEFAQKLSKLKNFNIDEHFNFEEYIVKDVQYDKVRQRDELFLIDFNKNKVKVFFQSLIGFYTRKKAKETLFAVQEEEKKIDVEIKKMDMELDRIRAIDISLRNVCGYFEGLISVYERLLMMLENSVNTLYFMSMTKMHKLVKKEMSIRSLPLTSQKEIQAILTISEIMKEMVEVQLVSVKDDKQVVSYEKDLKKSHTEVDKIYKAA